AGSEACDVGRGLDADAAQQTLSARCGERRRRESDGEFQSARAGAGGNNGKELRAEETRRTFGRECSGGTGSVRSRGGDRSEYFYAKGCTVWKLCGSEDVRGEGDAGGWIDFRLRTNRG